MPTDSRQGFQSLATTGAPIAPTPVARVPTEAASASQTACCAPNEQLTCCAPSEKSRCCGPEATAGGGCRCR